MTYQNIIFSFQKTHSSKKKKKIIKKLGRSAEEAFHKAGEHFTRKSQLQ